MPLGNRRQHLGLVRGAAAPGVDHCAVGRLARAFEEAGLQHELLLEAVGHLEHGAEAARLLRLLECPAQVAVERPSLRREIVGERILGGVLAGCRLHQGGPDVRPVAVLGAPPEPVLTRYDSIRGSVRGRLDDLDSLRVRADRAGRGIG